MGKPDQLRELFRMQKSLNERIGVRTDGMSEADQTKWISNYCRALTQESGYTVKDESGNKHI